MARRSLRWLVGRTIEGRAWRPSHALFMRDQVLDTRRNERTGYSDRDHLVAAADWLARAQDAATDGGVMGRYFLHSGWTSSYPETTGYIIPTFLALAKDVDPRFHERARRCIEFLLPLQLPVGAFPGAEVAENSTQPSIFNTAQILNGLVAWHAATGDERVGQAARRAADWLVSQQDEDGAWRKHIYNRPTTYTAHASCWLAEAGQHFGVPEWKRAAERHLDWVLTHVDPTTGWIRLAGFSDDADTAVTHTLAYTLWGVLYLSQVLGREDAALVAKTAAERVARRLELSGWLPGELKSDWKAARSDYACLTGNAQMALVWFWLAEIFDDWRFVNAALKAIDLVKAAQPMRSTDPGIRGGIPGSAPAWGGYITMGLPNWAAKFFIDALYAKRRCLASFGDHADEWMIPPDVAQTLPPPTSRGGADLRVVLLTSPGVHKVPQMVNAWRASGFRPAAVVIEHRDAPPASVRLARRIREDGVVRVLSTSLRQRLASRARSSAGPAQSASVEHTPDVAAFCAAEGIPVVSVGALSTPGAVAAVRALNPDLLVHAGAGILRRDILSVPKLGTLNAHMGILPRFRGMNVGEWARFEGNPVGCTVHLVDEGIDTGDILVVREVDPAAAGSIAGLRNLIDDAQIQLLGQVVHWVMQTKTLPPRRSQTQQEGRQYFRMHADLRALLETALEAARHGVGVA